MAGVGHLFAAMPQGVRYLRRRQARRLPMRPLAQAVEDHGQVLGGECLGVEQFGVAPDHGVGRGDGRPFAGIRRELAQAVEAHGQFLGLEVLRIDQFFPALPQRFGQHLRRLRALRIVGPLAYAIEDAREGLGLILHRREQRLGVAGDDPGQQLHAHPAGLVLRPFAEGIDQQAHVPAEQWVVVPEPVVEQIRTVPLAEALEYPRHGHAARALHGLRVRPAVAQAGQLADQALAVDLHVAVNGIERLRRLFPLAPDPVDGVVRQPELAGGLQQRRDRVHEIGEAGQVVGEVGCGPFQQAQGFADVVARNGIAGNVPQEIALTVVQCPRPGVLLAERRLRIGRRPLRHGGGGAAWCLGPVMPIAVILCRHGLRTVPPGCGRNGIVAPVMARALWLPGRPVPIGPLPPGSAGRHVRAVLWMRGPVSAHPHPVWRMARGFQFSRQRDALALRRGFVFRRAPLVRASRQAIEWGWGVGYGEPVVLVGPGR